MKKIVIILTKVLVAFLFSSCTDPQQELLDDNNNTPKKVTIDRFATINVSDPTSVYNQFPLKSYSLSGQGVKYYVSISRPDELQALSVIELTNNGFINLSRTLTNVDSIFIDDTFVISHIIVSENEKTIHTNSYLVNAGDTLSFFQKYLPTSGPVANANVQLTNANPGRVTVFSNASTSSNNVQINNVQIPVNASEGSRIFISTTNRDNQLDKSWLSQSVLTPNQTLSVDINTLTSNWLIVSPNTSEFIGHKLFYTLYGVYNDQDPRGKITLQYEVLDAVGQSRNFNIPSTVFPSYIYQVQSIKGDSSWLNYNSSPSAAFQKYKPKTTSKLSGKLFEFKTSTTSKVDFFQLELHNTTPEGYTIHSFINSFGTSSSYFIPTFKLDGFEQDIDITSGIKKRITVINYHQIDGERNVKAFLKHGINLQQDNVDHQALMITLKD